MAKRSNLVNLDAMIKREDFAVSEEASLSFENVSSISIRDFTRGGLIGPNLRKPDFQRETNHWSPEQVLSLLECFANGDLIPSVILWKSPTYLFVIDGGHRLSALKAWIEDDYGDGPISQAFFGHEISEEQRRISSKTRQLINDRIGSWKHNEAKITDENLDANERKIITALATRELRVQWVTGDADKAEKSFFKINTKGTPLDDIEELLLKNRRKPISISARAIIRAGKGHRYWSYFSPEKATEIESLAKNLHTTLFDPEIKKPIKTLELPLGGPKGVRAALQVLIDLILIAIRDQTGIPKNIEDILDDEDGSRTIETLQKVLKLSKRITGNDDGSLGLHPAVYFYGPTGRHSSAMFMGTFTLVAQKLSNNDKDFFKKFTKARQNIERTLITQKDLIATILQKHISRKRVEKYADLLDSVIKHLNENMSISNEELVKYSGLDGKVVIGKSTDIPTKFSDDSKSEAFIRSALSNAIKCPICNGYLDVEKSASYDHIIPRRDGGTGNSDNCQITHPYCNQAYKN